MKEHEQKSYEGIFILKSDVTNEQIESVRRILIRELSLYSMNKKLSDLIIFQNLGKKVLAYEIIHGGEKYKEGYYISLELGYFTKEGIQQVDKLIKAHRDVLKHIIVTLDEDTVEDHIERLVPFSSKTASDLERYQLELLSTAGSTSDEKLNTMIEADTQPETPLFIPKKIDVHKKNLNINAEDILYGIVEVIEHEHKGGDK